MKPARIRNVSAPPLAPVSDPQTAVEPIESGGEQALISPYTPKPLKSVFKGMATYGYNPRRPERARHLILAQPKHGKSSLGVSCPTAAVLDFEGGANAVTNPRAYIFNLSGTPTLVPGDPRYAEERAWLMVDPWERYLKVKDLLIEDSKSADPQFTTVVVDSLDVFLDRISSNLCRAKGADNISDGAFGKYGGFHLVSEQVRREFADFESAGYGLVIPTHLTEKRMVDGNVALEPLVFPSVFKAVLRMVDQVVSIKKIVESRAAKKKITTPKGVEVEIDDPNKRIITTAVTLRTVPMPENPDRGCRVSIPDELTLPQADGWEQYASAYNAEVARVRAEQAGA